MRLPSAHALHEDRDFKLGLRLVAGAAGLARPIGHPHVQKAGLTLAMPSPSFDPQRVLILGREEVAFLASLAPAAAARALAAVVAAQVPAVVVTRGLEPPAGLQALAAAEGLPLFVSPLSSGQLIARLHQLLFRLMRPGVSLHGVLLDVTGVGVLLTGASGVGKSECALDLVLRGHRLVGDDTVLVRQRGDRLVGLTDPVTRHHMEIRGLGIISIRDLFGAASIRDQKTIDVVIEMVEWEQGADYDRLGLDEQTEAIMGVAVPKLRLPIRPGRNVASIVEVAARNHLLKRRGHHCALAFKEGLERRLAAASADAGAGGS